MFGIAWAEARDLARAIRWYEKARAAPDGSASLKSAEQLGSLLARTAWEHVRDLHDDRLAALPGSGERALAMAIRDVRQPLDRGLRMLVQLNDIQPTAERESLCASAFKRKLMLENLAARYPLAQEDRHMEDAYAPPLRCGSPGEMLEAMEIHYANAERLERGLARSDWYYPALNRLAAALVRHAGTGWLPEPGDIAAIRACIKARIETEADFYSVVAGIELDFYVALAEGRLAVEQGKLLAQFDDLYRQVQAPRWWNSVRDQIDFIASYRCGDAGNRDAADSAEQGACARIRERLSEIAPRSHTPEPEPERTPHAYPAFV